MQADQFPALKVETVCKRFGSTEALSNVDLELWPGEVHCLVGENGAGKSTLVKIVTGIEKPDHGSILINGKTAIIDDVNAARKLGVGAVYQHPVVFPNLSVTENIFAGQQLLVNDIWWPLINKREMRHQVKRVFADMGVKISPDAVMDSLSTGDRQLVEIAKALVENARILILDEPTASLSDNEVASLFSIVRKLVKRGVAILFISHRIEEIFKIGDRVTVLRDGQRVAAKALSEVTREQLIELMVGRPLNIMYDKREVPKGDVLLQVDGWGRRGVFADVSFSVRAGEILGFAGLVGAGRTEVARTLYGADEHDTGRMWLCGRSIVPRSPARMLKQGLAYMPEDRHGSGLALQWPIFKNISLPILRIVCRWWWFLNPALERQVAQRYVRELQIRPPHVNRLVQYLSGGNQQKVLLAKWLATNPSVLILDEPTAGIDIGAKAEVHRVITELAEKGVGLILISSDLPELLAMSDRIIVFCEGRIVGAFSPIEATQEAIMKAATDYQLSVDHCSNRALAHGAASVHG